MNVSPSTSGLWTERSVHRLTSARVRRVTSQPARRYLSPISRPLVVTSEPALLEELLRLCEAAGSPPLVAADAEALQRAWPGASVVLLGAELAEAAIALPRRARVVVVGSAG